MQSMEITTSKVYFGISAQKHVSNKSNSSFMLAILSHSQPQTSVKQQEKGKGEWKMNK